MWSFSSKYPTDNFYSLLNCHFLGMSQNTTVFMCVPLNANELVLLAPFSEEGGDSRAQALAILVLVFQINIPLLVQTCYLYRKHTWFKSQSLDCIKVLIPKHIGDFTDFFSRIFPSKIKFNHSTSKKTVMADCCFSLRAVFMLIGQRVSQMGRTFSLQWHVQRENLKPLVWRDCL